MTKEFKYSDPLAQKCDELAKECGSIFCYVDFLRCMWVGMMKTAPGDDEAQAFCREQLFKMMEDTAFLAKKMMGDEYEQG